MKNKLLINFFAFLLPLLFSISSLKAQVSGNGGPLSLDPASATIVDPTITVGGSIDITNMTVQITSNYYASDILSFNASVASSYGITGNYTTMTGVTGILNFSGTTSPANWQAILRTVTFLNANAACGPSARKIVFMPGKYLYNVYNEHYYEFVNTSLNWKNAKVAAAQRSFNGMQGYLATSTSVGENNFIWKLMANDAWVGATYDNSELVAAGVTIYAYQTPAIGKVYWVTGPEKGTFISSGLNSPVAQNGQYMNWNSGEPNNYSNTSEFYVQLYSSNGGKWNDLPLSSSLPYLVEYGGMPNDNPQNATFNRTLALTSTVGGEITGGNIAVCTGSNSTVLTTTAKVSGVSILRWESSLDNFITAGTTISNTSATLTVNNLTQTTYFRSIANGNSCSVAPSASTKITVGTSVAGNLSADYTSLCNGSSAAISLTGNNGDVLNWQSSPDNSNWSDINHTGVIYNTPNLSTGTYYYRVQVQNSSCASSVISSSINIAVSSGAGSVGGSVSGIASVCGAVNAGSLSLTGYTGAIQKWQSSVDNGIIWKDISNTTTTLNFTNQATTTKYKAIVKNASCNAVSSTVFQVSYYGDGNTWLGTQDTNYGNAGNWTCNVPADGSDIIISTDATYMPLLDQDRILGSISFQDNTLIGINGHSLTVNGSTTGPSTGTFKGSAASSIIFNGTTNLQPVYFDQSIPGSSNLFADITVNKNGNVQTTPASALCTPTAVTSNYGMGITQVILGSINKTSSASSSPSTAYSNYYSTDSATLDPSTGYSIQVKTGTATYPQNVKVWIDWNNDGTFDAVNELVGSGTGSTGGSVYTINFTTPAIAGAVSGGTKTMRVQADYYQSATVSPCNGQYGEFEDYKILLTPMPSAIGSLALGGDVITANNFVITKGKIYLGNHNLSLGAGASLTGYDADNYVVTNGTGRLGLNISTATTKTFPVGDSAYNPVAITNNSGSADDFTVKVLNEVYVEGTSGDIITSPHVKRTWDIHKNSANGGAGVNFVFNWNDGEADGLADPGLFHFGGSFWSKKITGSTSHTSNSLTYTGYTGSFSPFAVAENTFTLPLVWIDFTAKLQKDKVHLNWSTGSEQNTRNFIVQHRTTETAWQTIGSVNAAGNSSTVRNYSYWHNNPVAGVNYYRILQYDLDGRSSYSMVKTITYNLHEKFAVTNNPVNNGILSMRLSEAQSISLLAADGKLIWTKTFSAGSQQTDVSYLASGYYIVRANNGVSIQIIIHNK